MSESLTDPGLVHLARPTDDTSIFEHARGAIERREHGYCSDDAGRALIVAVRSADPCAFGLVERDLGFLAHMYLGEGWFALRMGFDRTLDGRWALIHRPAPATPNLSAHISLSWSPDLHSPVPKRRAAPAPGSRPAIRMTGRFQWAVTRGSRPARSAVRWVL